MQVSIICPCYNEEKNIQELYEKFQIVAKSIPIEVIFVDNGSEDSTRELLFKTVENSSFAKISTLDINQGYGGGILHGLKEASSDFIGWTHADLQTSPHDIIHAYHILKENNFNKNIYVKGKRTNRPFIDTFLSNGMSLVESLIFGSLIYEVNAQPNLIHKSFYESWDNPPKDFSIDLFSYYMAIREKLDIKRIAVQFPSRKHGHSKWNKGPLSIIKFILTTLKFSLSLRKEYFLK